MDMLDKIRKFRASRPKSFSEGRVRGIYHKWKDGDNIVRLAGGFLETKTHYIAPNPKRQERGLCQAIAFQGDGALAQEINCFDWDVIAEEPKKKKTCPFCKLAAIARALLKQQGISEEEKKDFTALKQLAGAKSNLRWNIVDRDDPFITLVDDSGNEKRVLGFKIAKIGMEAWNDIDGIFEQCQFDIADPKEGIDIKVIKGQNSTRTVYSAQAILQGTSLKVTPFSQEEMALHLHDLKAICGKMSDLRLVNDAMHEDLRNLLEVNTEGDVEESPVELTTESDVQAAVQDVLAEDNDGLMGAEAVPEPVAPPVAPKAPVVAPRAPVAAQTPKAPIVAPKAPVVAPKAPVVAPKAPVAVNAVRTGIAIPRKVGVANPQ